MPQFQSELLGLNGAGLVATVGVAPGSVTISTTDASSRTTSIFSASGSTLQSAADGNGSSTIAQASSSVEIQCTAAFLGTQGTLIVGPAQLDMVSNVPADSSLQATHALAFVASDMSNAIAYETAIIPRQAYVSGSALWKTTAPPTMVVPIPFPLPAQALSGGVKVSQLFIEYTVIAKCLGNYVGSGPDDSPVAGNYNFQKGYSSWVNNNGSIGAANVDASQSPQPFVQEIFRRESWFISLDSEHFITIDIVVTIVVNGSNLELHVDPAGDYSTFGGGDGINLIQAYATLNYC